MNGIFVPESCHADAAGRPNDHLLTFSSNFQLISAGTCVHYFASWGLWSIFTLNLPLL